MKLKCQCCGFEQQFDSQEAAFQAGWDAPPHFTGYVACNLCPGACLVMGLAEGTDYEALSRVVRRPVGTLKSVASRCRRRLRMVLAAAMMPN